MPVEKDEELKKQLTEKLQQEKLIEMRNQLAQDRSLDRARQLDKLRNGRYTKDERGNLIDRWDTVMAKADNAIRSSVESYTDWRAAMSALISLYTELNEALGQDLKELFTHVFNFASDAANQMVLDPMREKWSKKPEVILPKLSYMVNADADNRIKIEPLKELKEDQTVPADINEQNQRVIQSINELFEKGVEKWLDDMNYKKNSREPGKWLHKDTGEELTRDVFNRLKNDPEKGLSQILSEHFDLDFSEKHSGPQP